MKLLLDTHIALWAILDDDFLSLKARNKSRKYNFLQFSLVMGSASEAYH